jgi:hypothetical protein
MWKKLFIFFLENINGALSGFFIKNIPTDKKANRRCHAPTNAANHT